MALGFITFAHNAHAAETAAFTDAQKTELQKIIRESIKENPEIIIESVQEYQVNKQRNLVSDAEKKFPEYKEFLTAASNPSIGNQKGDVTIVEFFDYNCGYCKRALPDIQKLVDEDKNVRVVFKELPILSPASLMAAQWAVAAHKQGKYFDYHKALMDHKGNYDEASLSKIAKDLGLDVNRMAKDAMSDATREDITKSLDASKALGIQGTPGFIINGKIYPGYLGEDGLKQAVAKVRTEKG